VVLLLALLLAGCGADTEQLVAPRVDVDTPQLRAIKARAGIADCPRGEGTGDGGLPDVVLPCLGGGTPVDLARLRGPMVINLWAQWCGPCREELPHYQAFSKRYAGKVAVLGIDWRDYRPELALKLAAQSGVTYPLAVDSEPRLRAPGNVLPQVILVDADGRVVHQEAVQIKSVRQLAGLVRTHLGVSR